MTRQFVQTDSAADHLNNVACSGLEVNTETALNRECAENGSAGSAEVLIDISATTNVEAYAFFESAPNEPGLLYWGGAAQVWQVPIRITTADSHVELDEIHICRISDIGTNIATLVSRTSLGQACTVGIKSNLLVATPTTGAPTDRFQIVVGFKGDGTARQIGITPDQTIGTPLGVRAERGLTAELVSRQRRTALLRR